MTDKPEGFNYVFPEAVEAPIVRLVAFDVVLILAAKLCNEWGLPLDAISGTY